MSNLRIVYMGTPEFAVPGLKLLLESGFNIVGVITAADKPKGRGLISAESPVKEYAKQHNLPVLQPEKLKDTSFIEQLKSLRADLQIVVAFRMLPEIVWSMPSKGTFNLHASLLPQYRGAAPINWAIINGEAQTGLSTFFLTHEIDTGDLILQEAEDISETDTAGTLYERLMHKGASLILKTVQLIESGTIVLTKQDTDQLLKPAPKIFKENCKIEWNKSSRDNYNFIRGLSPYPTAFCYLNGEYCKIFEVIQNDVSSIEPGGIDTDNKSYLDIGCLHGSISIISLQIEGKKRMNIKDFLAGNKVIKVE